jgi:hypothetical protein
MRRILIIIVILLLVGTGVWYFVVRPKQQGGVSPVPNVLQSFFPNTTTSTGSFGNDTIPGTLATGTTDTSPAPVFKQITARPIAGYSIFSISSTAPVPLAQISKTVSKNVTPTIPTPVVSATVDHVIRYVSRANGYVYEIKNGGIPLQISNIFIPNVYEAMFADGNNTAILRFLRSNNQTIATYSVPVPPLNPDGTRTQKSGTYLPDNISALAVSPDSTQIARITADSTGGSITTSSTLGTNIKTAARSPFTEWLPLWANKTVYVQAKAASIADGFLYSVDQPTARLRRILGNVAGLTTSVSPSGAYVLYSESTGTGFTTHLFNTKTNVTTDINLAILPEKCAWLQNEDLICAGNSTVVNGTYPDAWYAGTVHFSDQLYHITTASNVYSVLYNGQGQSFDMTNLHIDEGQRLVYFIDKTTGLLWQFSY